jgi:hypothetical protein
MFLTKVIAAEARVDATQHMTEIARLARSERVARHEVESMLTPLGSSIPVAAPQM